MFSRIESFLKKNNRAPLNNLILPEKPRPAAVLLLVYENKNDYFILFTKRSEEVLHHKGQICFPGGVMDKADASLLQTALRESSEEIGLAGTNIITRGKLGEVVTPTGFQITPFVGELKSMGPWQLSVTEIAAIFDAPISHFLDPKNFGWTTRTYFGQSYQDPVFSYDNHKIWGATARILGDFLDVWKKIKEL